MSKRRKNQERRLPIQNGNYLKNAEMSLEGNYNQIDGILGNAPSCDADLTDGQTYDDLRELAPETLPEEKRSVLERLEQARERQRAAAEPEDACRSMER
ncbi:DUF4316 domain-containing protein [Geosporobacter ferrireducens]|jgi:hypothetical protein|uniref:DUF4316 domain-containing protein n=1 Tax=Geosporobacter ferrireducens TaxID=1424294 RepID=A0A1D8GCZ8_9FIRM|nr:DUF4316 domain-containing protein [Geosporobacter ferrireducens]AOT68770.1 hypothetical protein Gferi_03770 [Geosporobacter ferrireducens]